MNAKKMKFELGDIATKMTELETKMARSSFHDGQASEDMIAGWVVESSRLSSRLNKVWKSVKDKPARKKPKARKDGLRAFTPEELRERFLTHMLYLCKYWSTVRRDENNNATEQDRMEGLCHSILAYIDGATLNGPTMDMVVRPHPSDKAFCISKGENWIENGTVINNCPLHELFFKYKPTNKVNS